MGWSHHWRTLRKGNIRGLTSWWNFAVQAHEQTSTRSHSKDQCLRWRLQNDGQHFGNFDWICWESIAIILWIFSNSKEPHKSMASVTEICSTQTTCGTWRILPSLLKPSSLSPVNATDIQSSLDPSWAQDSRKKTREISQKNSWELVKASLVFSREQTRVHHKRDQTWALQEKSFWESKSGWRNQLRDAILSTSLT